MTSHTKDSQCTLPPTFAEKRQTRRGQRGAGQQNARQIGLIRRPTTMREAEAYDHMLAQLSVASRKQNEQVAAAAVRENPEQAPPPSMTPCLRTAIRAARGVPPKGNPNKIIYIGAPKPELFCQGECEAYPCAVYNMLPEAHRLTWLQRRNNEATTI